MGRYTLFVFVHTLNKILIMNYKSIVVKMGRSVQGGNVPHEIKNTFVFYETMLSFLTFLLHTKIYICFHCMPQIKHFYNWAEEFRAEESQYKKNRFGPRSPGPKMVLGRGVPEPLIPW